MEYRGGTRDWGRSVMWKQKYKDKGKLHVNTGKGDGCRCGKKWNAKPDNKRVRTCGSKVEKRTTLKNGYLFYDKKKKNILVGGDFNCTLEKEKSSLPFKTFIKKYGLIDAMATLQGKQVGHTWKNTRGVESRLDYILVDKKCKIKQGKLIPALFTDHQMVEVEVEIKGTDYGKGYWKLNNEVLMEKEYKKKICRALPLMGRDGEVIHE